MTMMAHKNKNQELLHRTMTEFMHGFPHMILVLLVFSFHRGITLVCLKCDFLADTSGLDRMAKHLNQRKTHTCQVVIENGMYMCLFL